MFNNNSARPTSPDRTLLSPPLAPPPQVRVVWEALLWATASSLPGGLAARPAVRSALAALVERRLEVGRGRRGVHAKRPGPGGGGPSLPILAAVVRA